MRWLVLAGVLLLGTSGTAVAQCKGCLGSFSGPGGQWCAEDCYAGFQNGSTTCKVAGCECFLQGSCGAKTRADIVPEGSVYDRTPGPGVGMGYDPLGDSPGGRESLPNRDLWTAWGSQASNMGTSLRKALPAEATVLRDCRGYIRERRYDPVRGRVIRESSATITI